MQRGEAGFCEQAGVGGRIEGVAGDFGAELLQPQRQPAPLKPVWPVRKTRLPRQNALEAHRLPDLPGRAWRCPQVFEQVLFAQGVHGLPEAVCLIGGELAFARERLQRLALPGWCRPFDVVDAPWARAQR